MLEHPRQPVARGDRGVPRRPGRRGCVGSQTSLSATVFTIGERRGWEATTSVTAEAPARNAEVYVFALHTHRAKATADPLDVLQREFYVLPAAVLKERCPKQKRIRLAPLLKLGPRKTGFRELGETIATLGPASS